MRRLEIDSGRPNCFLLGFWRGGDVFPRGSLQVPKVLLKMFPIAPHF
jgi:hypothetical protein